MNQETKDRIMRDLKKGKSVALVASELGFKYSTTYNYARSMGYKRSWRRVDLYKNYNGLEGEKLKLRDNEILRLYDSGIKQIKIAKQFKLTRERVRQIIESNNRITATDRLRLNREKKLKEHKIKVEQDKAAKKQAALNRLQVYLDKFKPYDELWNQGATVSQLAEKLGVSTNTFGWYINKCRKHGMFKRKK